MRICLLSVEIFAWGKYGGFGRATRTIGRELAARGHEVLAIVPRRKGQRPVERLDGMTVLSYAPHNPLAVAALVREANAQIYHSCEPSFATWIAARSAPDRGHLVTCRDPRDRDDWKTEFSLPSRSRPRVVASWLFENGPFVKQGVRLADAVYTAARCLIPKAAKLYGLGAPPGFLPTPIPVPEEVRKAPKPTVSFVGRLDRRKRPELFLQLAERFPDVDFIAVGASNDRGWDRRLHEGYGSRPNLSMRGFVNQFRSEELSRILAASWILVNTSAREGLPNAMLEAAAHRCAILSAVDPDGFASRFGEHVQGDDFAAGLERLLDGDRWRERGLAAWRHVAATFATAPAIEAHLDAYRQLLERRARGGAVPMAGETARPSGSVESAARQPD